MTNFEETILKEVIKGIYAYCSQPMDYYRTVIWDDNLNLYLVTTHDTEKDYGEIKSEDGRYVIFTMPPGAYFLTYSDYINQLKLKTPKKVNH